MITRYPNYLYWCDLQGKLQQLIEEDGRTASAAGTVETAGPSLQTRLDVDDPDIIIAGATNTRISREQVSGYCLLWK